MAAVDDRFSPSLTSFGQSQSADSMLSNVTFGAARDTSSHCSSHSSGSAANCGASYMCLGESTAKCAPTLSAHFGEQNGQQNQISGTVRNAAFATQNTFRPTSEGGLSKTQDESLPKYMASSLHADAASYQSRNLLIQGQMHHADSALIQHVSFLLEAIPTQLSCIDSVCHAFFVISLLYNCNRIFSV